MVESCRCVQLICRSETFEPVRFDPNAKVFCRGHSTSVTAMIQQLLLLLLAIVTLAMGLGRFSEEEESLPPFRPEPLARLPGMVEAHQARPPGFAPPPEIIRTLRREHLSEIQMSRHHGRSRVLGLSRRRNH